MKSKNLLFAFVLFLASASSYAQIIYQENFQSGMPATFTLRNVDNFTPDPSVAFVNAAWVARGDSALNPANIAAFSTSYYGPGQQANDWMFLPRFLNLPTNAQLTWKARVSDVDFPDNYEVRVLTGATVPAVPSNASGAVVYATTLQTTEGTAWTTRTVNLSQYAGQNIYIAFRNNAIDQFLLLIDDITVETIPNYNANLTAVAPVSEYTLTPNVHKVPTTLSGSFRNDGVLSLTNVQVTAKVFNSTLTQVYTASSSIVATLTSGATSNFTIAGYTPAGVGDYLVTFNLTSAETDADRTNNVDTQFLSITNSIYARDNGQPSGALGIGIATGGYLGQKFTLINPATVNSIGVFYGAKLSTDTNFKIAACIWSMVSDSPSVIIARTDTLIRPDTTSNYYILPLGANGVSLPAGNYAFTAIEFTENAAVGQTDDIFTPNTTFVRFVGSGGWRNNEEFGPNFSKPYIIRPIFCAPITPNVVAVNQGCTTQSSITLNPSGFDGFLDYLWSNGSTNDTITNIAPATYTVSVTDGNCSATASAAVTSTVVTIAGNVSATNKVCNTLGTATFAPSNGTPGYTYNWTGGSIAATAPNLAVGNYTVTVTDAAGCSGTAIASVADASISLSLTATATQSTCTANTGSATVAVNNGTAAFSYNWNNAQTTPTITNVGPGTYNVTVIDANGCSSTATTNVTTPNGPSASASVINVSCFNGSTGAIDVTVIGGTGVINYNWSSVATTQDLSGLPAGTYTVTVLDANNCSFTVTSTVNQPASGLNVSGVKTDVTNGINGSVDLTVTGGTAPYTYTWGPLFSSTQDVSNLPAGVYTVTVTDDNLCTSTATFVLLIVGIDGLEYVNTFNVYPNPTSNAATIKVELTEMSNLTIELFNMNGQLVVSEKVGNVQHLNYVLNTTSLNSGVYTIRLVGEKFNVVQRLTVSK